jgi:integrase
MGIGGEASRLPLDISTFTITQNGIDRVYLRWIGKQPFTVPRHIMPDNSTWPSFAFDADSAWGRCYASFLRAKHEHSGSSHTLYHYRQALILFFSEPKKSPENYTREDVETFIYAPIQANGRTGQQPGPGTINNRLSILSSFYDYAASYRIDTASGPAPLLNRMSPTAGLKQLQRPKPPYRALTADELRRFFAAIDTTTIIGARDYALFLCYFILARRRDEIRLLKWGEITEGVIIDSETRRTTHVYAFYGKGHKSQVDSAELPETCYNAITRYLDLSGKRATIQPDHPIFTAVPGRAGSRGYDPSRPLAPHAIWMLCKRIAKRAGLDPKRVTVHSFRHTSARIRYEKGSDIREIQTALRHKSLATTDIYLQQLMTIADPGALLLEKFFEEA